MKAFILFGAMGPVLVVTRYDSLTDEALSQKLAEFGKLVAFEVPMEQITRSYAAHYAHLFTDPKASDEFLVLDADGKRIFTNISFKEFGSPIYFEPDAG